MFLIDADKPNIEKKFKTCFIFYATVLGRGAYKIKPNLLLFAFGLLAAIITLFKRNEKRIFYVEKSISIKISTKYKGKS